MELTELKRVQNTKELPGYVNGAVSGDAGESDKPNFFLKIGLAFTKEGAIGKAFTEDGFFGKTGKFMEGKNKMFGTNGGAIATGAMGVVDMVGQIGAAGKFNRTADDLLQDAGKSQNNIGGVGYTVQNDVDRNQIEKETDAEATSNTIGLTTKGASTGAAIGSLAGPVGSVIGGAVGAIGGFIGGLFGGGAKKREMKKQLRLAEIKRINQNDFSRSGALTTVLLNNLALNEGDQSQQMLYAAKDGKLPGYSSGATPVWSLAGMLPRNAANCRLSNGEHIVLDDTNGNAIADVKVGHGRDHKDSLLGYVPKNAWVINPEASEYLEQTGDIEGAKYMTSMKIHNKNRNFKCGKLPGFSDGTFAINNVLGNLVPAAVSFARANEIKSLALYQPNSESLASNPGIYEGLRDMDQRINSYHILPHINDILAKGFNQINNVGGVGGGLKNLWRLDAVRNAMDSMADQFRAIDQANAQFKQQLGQAKVNAYSSIADRAMKGRQFDDTLYAQEHGAQTEGWSSQEANGYGLLGNMFKGFNDYSMWKRNMEYFENELAENKADREAKLTEQKNMNLAKSLWTGLGINPYVTLHALQNTASVPQPIVTGTKVLLTKEEKDAIKQQLKAAKLQQKQARIKARQEQREAELQRKAQAKIEKISSKRPFTPFLPQDAVWNSTGTGWVSGGRYVGINN